MQEQSKKLSELKEQANNVFHEALFSNPFAKKKEPTGPVFEDEVIVVNRSHSILFKQTGSIIVNPLPNYGVWVEVDWSSPEFSWLSNAEFKASSAEILGKGSSRKISKIKECDWVSGDFRGGKFIRGVFNGGTFLGEFGPGSTWSTNQANFIDGRTYETETILGLPNLTNLRKDKFSFNFISVPPAHNITIELESGLVHVISVIKRLDSKSSTFSYNVTNGVTNETKSVNLRWGQLRGQNQSEFKSNTVFTTTSIPNIFTDIFGLTFDSPIKMLTVDVNTNFEAPKWSEKEETPKELATKQFVYELDKMPFLKIKQIPRSAKSSDSQNQLFFNFPASEDKKGFESVVNFINKGWLDSYVKSIRKAMDNGIVSGAPSNMPYLANLIGKQENISSENIDKNIYNSLLGLDMFLKYFVNNMVLRAKQSGPNRAIYDIDDEVGKKFIKDTILSMLGKGEAEKVSQSPGKKQPVKKVKKISIPESKVIVDNIYNILSERLKHL
jgi:hypothetical protein